VDRHREYVTEGDLLIANSAVQKKPEEHRFFVFNNLIIYTKREASLQAMIGISSARYKYVGSIPIQDGCTVREVIDNDGTVPYIFPSFPFLTFSFTLWCT